MYRERPSQISGAVAWSRVADGQPYRVLPDGAMDLIWVNGQLLVAGPDIRARHGVAAEGTRFSGLRFTAGVGPLVFGLPASELRDQRLALDELWPAAQAARLGEQVAEAADVEKALEAAAAGRLRATGPPEPWAALVQAALATGRSVAGLAADLGVSERQLHRRCLTAFGYGPKTLARILRLNRALDLVAAGFPLAGVAAVAGYADQAHMSRDVRTLAGITPTALRPS